MRISHHAKVRQLQRGIPEDVIDLILQYGTPIRKPGNATEYRILRENKYKIIMNLKHMINTVEKASQKGVLVCDDDKTVITIYHLRSQKRSVPK